MFRSDKVDAAEHRRVVEENERLTSRLANLGVVERAVVSVISDELDHEIDEAAIGQAEVAARAAVFQMLVEQRKKDLKSEAEQAAREYYESEEGDAEVEAVARSELEVDGSLERIKEDAKRRYTDAKRPEVEKELADELFAKVEEENPNLRAEIKHASSQTQRYREMEAKAKRDARSRLTTLSYEELLQEAELVAHREALEERIAQVEAENAEHRIKVDMGDMERSFMGTGVDISKIPKDSTLMISLGDKPNGSTGKVVINREIEFVSFGEGRFIVRADSFSNSDDSVRRRLALPENTVITIGSVVKDSGTVKYLPVIREGSMLHFDSDPSTPDTFHDTVSEVLNLKIDEMDPVLSRSFSRSLR